MNNAIDHVGIELTDSELALIQGGGFLGDVWNGIKKGATAVYNFAKSDTGKKILGAVATVVGVVFGGSSGGSSNGY